MCEYWKKAPRLLWNKNNILGRMGIMGKPADYDKIPTWEEFRKAKVAVPGIYCQKCGTTFALYSWSMMGPHGLDENKKPFYKNCFECPKEDNPSHKSHI